LYNITTIIDPSIIAQGVENQKYKTGIDFWSPARWNVYPNQSKYPTKNSGNFCDKIYQFLIINRYLEILFLNNLFSL